MDENNTNLENSTSENSQASSSPSSYGAPTDAEREAFGTPKEPETTTDTASDDSSALGAASTQSSADSTATEPAYTAFGTQSAFSMPQSSTSTQSTSHQEVFGGSVEGTPTNNYYTNTNAANANAPEEISKGFGIASLVMGILSILTCCCSLIGAFFGILGIIFFCVQPKDSEGKRPSIATVGLILSIVGLVLGLGMFIIGLFSSSDVYREILNQAQL